MRGRAGGRPLWPKPGLSPQEGPPKGTKKQLLFGQAARAMFNVQIH